MQGRTIEDQLAKYLADVHSIEVQALAQMKAAPKLAGDGRLAAAFRRHLDETAGHERLVREELERRGADPSTLKDMAGRVGGWAMVAFARIKLAGFAYAFEHLEIAAYELLRRVADRAADRETAEIAERILLDGRRAAERIAATWDAAVDAVLGDLVAGGSR